MTTPTSLYSPLIVLAALGLLGLSQASAADVDTSQWKCEKCPYSKGLTATVDAGLAMVSRDSRSFGNYTGLDEKGARIVLGGRLEYKGDEGSYADATLDTQRFQAQGGIEGLFGAQLGYVEVPRTFAPGAGTPFLGVGSATLTLPAGYPAATSSTMPLGTTLQGTELGYKNKRLALGGQWVSLENWTLRVNARHDVRDGTRPTAGSFFSTAAQLAAPVDDSTSQIEASASFSSRSFQASVSYLLSEYTNGAAALTWSNPFQAVQGGDVRGQLALAPSNRFHQLAASAAYQPGPAFRASADVAWGLGEQNVDFLPSTLNTLLPRPVPALPARSLEGQVETFNFAARMTAVPVDGLRVNASYAHDVRDNQTPIRNFPQVATDMFASAIQRSNTPFDQTVDRVKVAADYRAADAWRLSMGVDWDSRQRTYQEVASTRETTVWARAAVQAAESVSLGFKAATADRSHTAYGVARWFGSVNNERLRKSALAARERASFGARADWAVNESVAVGLSSDWARDDYAESEIGLQRADAASLGLDLAAALSEHTRLRASLQGERTRSRQAGSQLFSVPDWTGTVDDHFEVATLGITHAAIPDTLDLGADLTVSRSRSTTAVQTAVGEPPFPTARTSMDSLKMFATYKLSAAMSLTAVWWNERLVGSNWMLDGVGPATLPALLAFGAQTPQHRINVVRLTLRHRF